MAEGRSCPAQPAAHEAVRRIQHAQSLPLLVALKWSNQKGTVAMKFITFSISLLALVAGAERSSSYADALRDAIDQQAKAVENKMIAWRRDIHEHSGNPSLLRMSAA